MTQRAAGYIQQRESGLLQDRLGGASGIFVVVRFVLDDVVQGELEL
jgi:hypothetical protein